MNLGDVKGGLKWGCKAGDAPTDEIQTLLVAIAAHHYSGNTKRASELAGRFRRAFPEVAWDEVYGQKMLTDTTRPVISAILAQYEIV